MTVSAPAALADPAAALTAARALVPATALPAVRARVRRAEARVEAAGTSATRRGSPLERIFRDARCGSLQPATSDVCADWLGAAALGDDPEAGGRW